MNVLLANPPGKISFVSPPLGILYLAASLKEAGHRVWVIDYDLEKQDQEKLINLIKDNNIQIVGISIVTPKISGAYSLARFINEQFPKMTIFAGGPHATLAPEEILNNFSMINFVVQGEAEIIIKKIVERLEKNENLNNLGGVTFRQNNQIINNKSASFIEDLDSLPMPARELINIKKYAKHLKTSRFPATTMMTSRGCPFQCIYCSKPVTGAKFRARSPENVIKEIELLIKDFGIKEIIFYDDSFTLDRQRTINICDLIIQKGIKIRWQCETRVNLVNPDLLKKMKEAGCYQIAYGIESGSDRILQILKKGITIEQIKQAVEQTKKAGIQIIGYFMLGIPGETEEEIKQTIKFSKKLPINYAQFSIATAYPGTELYKIALQNNKILPDWSKSIYALGGEPTISLSDIPVEKLSDCVKKAYRSFYFRPSYFLSRVSRIKSVADIIFYTKGLTNLIKNI